MNKENNLNLLARGFEEGCYTIEEYHNPTNGDKIKDYSEKAVPKDIKQNKLEGITNIILNLAGCFVKNEKI